MYWADYNGDTADLSLLEHGAYLKLISAYWQNGGLPVEANASILLERCFRIASAKSEPERLAVEYALSRFFVFEENTYRHKRIDKELFKSLELREKRSEAGRVGGVKSASKRQANATANATAKGQAKVQAIVNQSQSHSSSLKEEEDIVEKSSAVDGFDVFWKAYPHHPGRSSKKETLKAYQAQIRSGATPHHLLNASQIYAASPKAMEKDREYVPAAQRWLAHEKWQEWNLGGGNQTNGDNPRIVNGKARRFLPGESGYIDWLYATPFNDLCWDDQKRKAELP